MADVEASALKVAIELVHVPSRARMIKTAALPDGMGFLLSIAADDEQALLDGVDATGRSREVVKGAASFFVEQVLLAADCDSYRTLGACDKATNAELRRNMALLLKALHPDLSQNKDRSVFTGRVTRAWEDLKTQERRDAYDATRRMAATVDTPLAKSSRPAKVASKTQRAKIQFVKNAARRQSLEAGREHGGFLRRAFAFLLGAKNGR
ncbi:MAG: DnaJ domain-containing protein [Hyphomicrobiaceae bacterium]